MTVKKIKCKNFRNLKNINIEPAESMNIICGENAQGKTNLLEAIWLFCGAKSFKNAKDSELINFNAQFFENEISFICEGIEKTAKIRNENTREAYLNNKKLKSPSLLAGSFYCVCFNPDDLSLVKEGPNLRRKFLDIAIGQLNPNYISLLKIYTRAIKQRNDILKKVYKDASLLPIIEEFEIKAAETGEKITEYRKNYIKTLLLSAPEIYNGISGGKESLTIEYMPSYYGVNLLEALNNSRKKDILAGATSVGPHRDDIIFKINGKNARDFASQGQQRSIALSLKLSEAKIIFEKTGEYPVILLDDVMSELDESRQNYILNNIKGRQVFLTCCEENNFKNLYEGKIIKIKNGECF